MSSQERLSTFRYEFNSSCRKNFILLWIFIKCWYCKCKTNNLKLVIASRYIKKGAWGPPCNLENRLLSKRQYFQYSKISSAIFIKCWHNKYIEYSKISTTYNELAYLCLFCQPLIILDWAERFGRVCPRLNSLYPM